MNITVQNMRKLIQRKFYTTEEKVLSYLELFLLTERISRAEYKDLTSLAGQVYAHPVLETPQDAVSTAAEPTSKPDPEYFTG